jgi:hypothetical protein
MKLEDVHLEEIILPKDYKKVIFEQIEITPELTKEGFIGGLLGTAGGKRAKERKYNFFLKELEPFKLRVIERDTEKDEVDDVLLYHLEIETESALLNPFKYKKFIKANNKPGKLNAQWAEWLGQQCEALSGEDFYDNKLSVSAPSNWTDICFETTQEDVFFRLCRDISTVLRALPETVENAKSDEPDVDENVEIIEDNRTVKDLKAIKDRAVLDDIFRNVVSSNFTAAAYFATQGAVETLAAGQQKVNTIYFVIDIDHECIRFTLDEDYPNDDNEAYFYTYKVTGKILKKFDWLCEKLSLSASQEACYYFGDGLERLNSKAVYEKVMDKFLEIMGMYNYSADMEGIFMK